MKLRFFLLGVVLIFLVGGRSMADEVKLPGHNLSDREAEAKASKVFLGQLVSLDPVNVTTGRGTYVGKVLYISHSANGITPARTTQNTTVSVSPIASDLSFPVTMTVGANENAPEVGKAYVFYAKDNTRPGTTGYEAVKLAPTSDHGTPSRTF